MSKHWKVLKLGGACAFFVASFFFARPSSAYQLITHEQMALSALTYLRTKGPHFEETKRWVVDASPERFRALRAVLLRGSVETDFRPDIWGESAIHAPSGGATNGSASVFFTSVFHFLVIREDARGKPIRGEYWKNHDGYAWRFSGQTGPFDRFFSLFSTKIRTDLSPALGGSSMQGIRVPYPDLPPYTNRFLHGERALKKMFSNSSRTLDLVFPPADIPAETAFKYVVGSERATRTTYEQWWNKIPMMMPTGKKTLNRRFSHMEIEGYPKNLGALGIALHMAQDLAMPHHTMGTLDYCHQELEVETERLACNAKSGPSQNPFFAGTYEVPTKNCQHLYDEKLVRQMLKEFEFFNLHKNYSLSSRLHALAHYTHRWRFGEVNLDAPGASIEMALDFLGTQLPSGYVFTGDRCSDLFKYHDVQEQIRMNFNLGVAASIVVIELAARAYENANKDGRKEIRN